MVVETRPKPSLSSFADQTIAKRLAKVGPIVSAFQQHATSALGRPALLLDMGTGSGIIGHAVAEELGAQCIELDVSEQRSFKESYFVISSCETLPFRSESFDYVICNHVIEHVRDQEQLLMEVKRVLKPGGLCYLATPSKYALLEPHYKLPFLSWLPVKLADNMVRLTRRGKSYDIQPVTRTSVHRLANLAGLGATDLTLDLIATPRRYRRLGLLAQLGGMVPLSLTRKVLPVAPSHVWLLQASS